MPGHEQEFKTACCLNALREHFDPLPKTLGLHSHTSAQHSLQTYTAFSLPKKGFDQIKHWFVFFNKKLNDELLSHVHLLRVH